ncbi:transglycosylase SLT domain-containing protein [Janthinobacterium agaricidamnosum]|uniref:Transglycosylase SLT domain protein n=1 Tax=Janthinobacterium agaricidamnosum NBRC 102515 = DSM 9628 TaxID=1349767 RepID=W0V4F7_9BURK|nr:transglycosylase SLT domain-containing protein [Janthinobacterium agaricidamnosum]CDG82243.1 transglycosylase SLT domain protein [Janthinobacterium agaricidamnosum NBRC 102515 = DSM 9628]
MHENTPKSTILAALVLALAPALSQAYESGPELAATPQGSSAPTLIPMAPQVTAKLPTMDTRLQKTDKLLKNLADGPDGLHDGDVWARIRSGYAIPDIDNQLVAKHIAWYTARPDYIARTTARASRYIYYVVQELEKRGMPTELALLPFIESAFNPQAFSSANAAGMWQFVPATGRDFNLKQNMFKDERRGVLASTDAALTYLQRLYDMFGDWQLALAAYNWGEGSVQRAIKKNQSLGKPTDFESLADLMPAETRNYVPKLQAVKNIIANPGQYGIALQSVDNQPYFTAVDKTSDIDLTIAAQLAELSLDEFKALNPQFNRPVITGSEKTKILLPQENAAKFTANLAQWGHALSTWTTHKITSARERIETLASRFGTTPDVLRQANNIPQRTSLKAGSTILVPKTSASLNVDIAPEVADNATMAFEADRPERKHSSRNVKLAKGNGKGPISLVKPRIQRGSSNNHHKAHR